MNNFRDLKVWNEGIDLAAKIYEITNMFPATEKYGLSNQMRRSATSIPSNIAEGAGRNSTKEFIHFLGISKGSANELFTQVEIAARVNLIDQKTCNETQESLTYILKMNYNLIESIAKRIKK